MRGVYFTSGTQEGRPVDRVDGQHGGGVRRRARASVAAPPTKPKSYFVRDVFQQVVFPDKDVAVRSASAAAERARWSAGRRAGGALAISAALAVPADLVVPREPAVRRRRRGSSSRSWSQARESTRRRGPLRRAPLEPTERDGRAAGARSRPSGPDVSMRFGLYPGERLMDPLHLAVERLVIRPLLDADASRCWRTRAGRATWTDRRARSTA